MVKAGLGSRSSKHWSVDHSQLVTNSGAWPRLQVGAVLFVSFSRCTTSLGNHGSGWDWYLKACP